MSKKKDETATAEQSAVASNGKAPPLSRRERFKKYAERRVSVALKKLAHVKNMGNRSSYEYTPEEATAVVLALEKAVDAVREAFTGTVEKRAVFTLF